MSFLATRAAGKRGRLRRGVGCPAVEKRHCLAPAALVPVLFLKVGS